MDSSSACEAIDMLLLVVPLTDGVVLGPRPLGVVRDGLILVFDKAPSVLVVPSSLASLASRLVPVLGVSDKMEVARGGGLTGSYAGLSGSAAIGRGVEGVECDTHFVPNPRVRAIGVKAPGVDGAAVTWLSFLVLGVKAFVADDDNDDDDVAAAAAAAAAACRMICSGMAGLGGCVL